MRRCEHAREKSWRHSLPFMLLLFVKDVVEEHEKYDSIKKYGTIDFIGVFLEEIRKQKSNKDSSFTSK